jgi:hypothetical protein
MYATPVLPLDSSFAFSSGFFLSVATVLSKLANVLVSQYGSPINFFSENNN